MIRRIRRHSRPPQNGERRSSARYRVGYGRPPKEHRFQPGESGNRIRPGVQSVPHTVQVLDLGLGQAVEAVLREQLGQLETVQLVGVHPGKLAGAHARSVGLG